MLVVARKRPRRGTRNSADLHLSTEDAHAGTFYRIINIRSVSLLTNLVSLSSHYRSRRGTPVPCAQLPFA